ncbi:amino acid dehydrogenase family protein [Stylonychia lemnae]|uniref:Amino acid dehydrogenase family protein n=1 Tax=Stylonychia lemnae TaxID=5949 RepID=A0A078AJ08_STYLE|nr:amino acid dehydrogenase family protein [Stylonychia lemnae]|eukprot:CDW81452.1 amino acid dehydrogenase family protein [Stylonychia lemnae]
MAKRQKLWSIFEKPVLAFILVGQRSDSLIYVTNKKKICKEIGIECIGLELEESVSQDELSLRVQELQSDPRVCGILVQLPLPKHIDENKILDLISPDKDVDGFHPYNIGNLALKGREPFFVSCTPQAVLELIKSVCPDIQGKNVTIVGKSNIVGLPLSLLLNNHNATVSLCHSQTMNLEEYVRRSDIFVAAIGKISYFKGEWIKEGAIVIDVGINVITQLDKEGNQQRLVYGDVEFNKAIEICSYITPVPGGVGPMTIAMLMKNILISWERLNGIQMR